MTTKTSEEMDYPQCHITFDMPPEEPIEEIQVGSMITHSPNSQKFSIWDFHVFRSMKTKE